MRKLPAKPEAPPEYLRQAKENNVPWGDFSRGPGGHALRQLKADAQAGLCGYCECRVVDECGILPGGAAHIDHFHQKSRPGNEHLTYEWANLVLSCMHRDSCGIHKDHQAIGAEDIINPNVEDARALISFVVVPRARGTNRIEAVPINGSRRARKTIDALNLNCNRLGIMRNVCWQTYKGDVQAIQDALNSPGCDSETEGICRTLAGELLQRMERGSFPSSMVACARAEIAMPE